MINIFKKFFVEIHLALVISIPFCLSFSPVFAADIGCTSTLYYCGTQIGDNVTVNTSVSAGLTPLKGYGIYLNSSRYDLNDINITTLGSAADGIFSNGNNGSYFISRGKVNITTSGSSADGINLGARGGPGSSPTYVSKNIVILSGDGGEIIAQGMGVRANNNLAEGSKAIIILGDNYTIKQTGTSTDNAIEGVGYAVYAGNRDQDISGFGTVDWLFNGYRNNNKGDSAVFIGDNANISSAGKSTASYKGAAVYANKGGVIQLGNNVSISAPEGAYHLFASTEKQNVGKNNAGQTAEERPGTILLKGGTTANKDGSITEIVFQSKGAGSIIKSGYMNYSYDNTDVIIDDNIHSSSGKFIVDGGMSAIEGGTIDLNFDDGSKFTGFSTKDDSSTINLAINGSNSRWQLTSDSQLSSLTLANAATVYLADLVNPLTSINRIILTTEHLSGNGRFVMQTNMMGTGITSNNFGDMVKVTGTSTGTHTVTFIDNKSGRAVLDGTERLRVIETADGGATFALGNNTYATSSLDIGAYSFILGRGDSGYLDDAGVAEVTNHWYLMPLKKGGDEEGGEGGGSIKNNTADNSGNILNINYLLSNVENQTLLQRMGELRRNQNNEGNFWLRTYAGKLTSFADSSLHGFDMDYNGVQMGADKYLGHDLFVGIMLGTARASVDYQVGDGLVQSHHIGLYGLYKTDSGWYVDSLAKLVYMNNHFNTQTGQGYLVQGDGKTNGYSFGLEAGKRFYLQQTRSGWYLEPQVQLTYSYQNSARIKANTGLNTELDSFKSLLGRTSIIAGYSVVDGNNPIDIYLKTGYVKEFDGKTGYSFNGAGHEEYQFNGNWWDNGIGVSAQIKQQHNIYLEADYALGDKFDKRQINVGYRYAF